MNVRTGFLDHENMGQETKTGFLSQILRKLWDIAHLAQTAIFVFVYHGKVAQGCCRCTFCFILEHVNCES